MGMHDVFETRVADSGGVDPDPDPTPQKKLNPKFGSDPCKKIKSDQIN